MNPRFTKRPANERAPSSRASTPSPFNSDRRLAAADSSPLALPAARSPRCRGRIVGGVFPPIRGQFLMSGNHKVAAWPRRQVARNTCFDIDPALQFMPSSRISFACFVVDCHSPAGFLVISSAGNATACQCWVPPFRMLIVLS
jgi:hypothetical protein